MIYPTLYLGDDTHIQFVDTDFDENPFLSMNAGEDEDTIEAFMILLQAFMNQFECGYDKGCEDYEDSLEN